MSLVNAWSYSRYAAYTQCPLAFKLRYIDKMEEPPSPAMARGDEVHKEVAAYIMNRLVERPKSAIQFGKLVDELKGLSDKFVEQQWGFTRTWKPTTWFGKETWLRVILDAGVIYEDNTADVIDHKTGKKYGTNADQMELFGLGLMCKYTHVTQVTTRLWYLDSGDEEVKTFAAADVPGLKAKWEAAVKPMFADTVFAPRPNEKCRFCHFSKSKGGPCRFG